MKTAYAKVEVPRRRRNIPLSLACVVPIASALLFPMQPAAAQGAVSPPADGQTAFNNSCRTCHSMDAGDNRLGPSLNGIVGKKAGSTEGFEFSSAMKGAGFEWTKEKLAAFIENPEATVPGNNMKPYAGIADAKTRDAIVAFLSDGKP